MKIATEEDARRILGPFYDPTAKPLTDLSQEDWDKILQKDAIMETCNALALKHIVDDFTPDQLKNWGVNKDGAICMLTYDYDMLKDMDDKAKKSYENDIKVYMEILRTKGYVIDKSRVTTEKKRYVSSACEAMGMDTD